MADTRRTPDVPLGDNSGPDISMVSARDIAIDTAGKVPSSISLHAEDKMEPSDEQLATLRRIADIPPFAI